MSTKYSQTKSFDFVKYFRLGKNKMHQCNYLFAQTYYDQR